MATSNIDKQSFGQAGATYLSGSGSDLTVTKDICAITIISDAVFSAVGTDTVWDELTDTGGNFDSDVFPSGITIYGQFSKVTLTSGAALCYHAV